MPGLPVYQGYCCPHCPYIARALSNLPKHQHQAHPEAPQPRPRQPLALEPGLPEPLAVSYQQFFPAQAGSSFFQVTPPAQVEQMKQAATMTAPEFIQAQLRAQLREALVEEAELNRAIPAPIQKHPTKVSP